MTPGPGGPPGTFRAAGRAEPGTPATEAIASVRFRSLFRAGAGKRRSQPPPGPAPASRPAALPERGPGVYREQSRRAGPRSARLGAAPEGGAAPGRTPLQSAAASSALRRSSPWRAPSRSVLLLGARAASTGLLRYAGHRSARPVPRPAQHRPGRPRPARPRRVRRAGRRRRGLRPARLPLPAVPPGRRRRLRARGGTSEHGGRAIAQAGPAVCAAGARPPAIGRMSGVGLRVSPRAPPDRLHPAAGPAPAAAAVHPGFASSGCGRNGGDGLLSGMPDGRGPAGLYEATPDSSALIGADGAPPPAPATRRASPDTASCRRRPRANHPRPGAGAHSADRSGAAARRAVHRRRGAPRGRVG